MIKQSLGGEWQMREVNANEWLAARVPGGTFTDLMAANKIPDPFDRENEKQVQWVADRDWEYRREFEVGDDLLKEDRVELFCAGLDTLAEVTLNGQPVGKSDNMFRSYAWDVTAILKPGKNTLAIVFRSPVAYINKRQQERKLPTMMNGGMAHLRKVQSHFGWDWGPRLPISGIWREIALRGYSTARLGDVRLTQRHADGRVWMEVAAQAESWRGDELTLQLRLNGPDGSVQEAQAPVVTGHAHLSLEVAAPQLWWPNGQGQQPLYRAEVSLEAGGRRLDERSFQVGLRRLELRQEPDAWGKTFTFVVNGVPLFGKGADWIPSDSFPARLTPERYERWIRDCAAANMNMLRIWGGGYYEDETFYDLCDRYGILIWQDFMYACAAYPFDDPAFLENARLEAEENIRRLRHRACLALWCGNNEIEMMWGMFKRNAALTAACDRFFYQLLPEWVAALDPDRPYWPSSPSSGKFLHQTNSDAFGDTHLWQVWHGLKPFTFYRKRMTRFASEFGMEAFPSLETIAGFCSPEDFRLESSVMAHHQRSWGGNDKMLYYLAERYRFPRDFSDLVYLTQVQQAEAIRIGVEHWRRNWPRCNGALYWQYNDCWPVTSWASVDYNGDWKALHYAAKRFYAPVALSLLDEGSRVGVYVSNDTPQAWTGSLRWTLETLGGEKIDAGSLAVNAGALAATCLKEFDFTAQLRAHGKQNVVFTAALFAGEERVAWQIATFAPEKRMSLPDPKLTWDVECAGGRMTVRLSSQGLARFVWLRLEGAQSVFTDNFIDLPAGWTARVSCALPPDWTAEQAEKALRVRSLADVVPGGSEFSDQFQRLLIRLKPINVVLGFAMGK